MKGKARHKIRRRNLFKITERCVFFSNQDIKENINTILETNFSHSFARSFIIRDLIRFFITEMENEESSAKKKHKFSSFSLLVLKNNLITWSKWRMTSKKDEVKLLLISSRSFDFPHTMRPFYFLKIFVCMRENATKTFHHHPWEEYSE